MKTESNYRLMSEEQAKKLAEACVAQMEYRLGIDERERLDYNKFYNFFASLQIPEKSDYGLVLLKHKKIGDVPGKEYIQKIEIRELGEPIIIKWVDIIPRGVIVTAKLEEEISKCSDKSLKENLEAKIVKINRMLGPKLTLGKHGTHAYSSQMAYFELLKDKEIRNSLLDLIEQSKEEYFGFLRVDYSISQPRSTNPGWYTPPQKNPSKSAPILIIPGISNELIELLEEREINLLGI